MALTTVGKMDRAMTTYTMDSQHTCMALANKSSTVAYSNTLGKPTYTMGIATSKILYRIAILVSAMEEGD